MSSGGQTNAATQVKLTYQGVIDDVVKNVRELFLNDGVDEQVLSDLREMWEAKLEESGVMNHPPPLIPKNKAPADTATKHFQQPAQQHSWSMHQHQPQHQQQSPQHKRHHHQQQQVQSVLPSVTSTVGSHITGPPALTSISTSLPVPPLVSQVTAAETATTSTAQSSVAQSTAALLQSNIASAAATSNVLPNLQYMLPGTAQGSNPSGYTVIVDPQTRLPIMVPLATVANLQMAKQLQALQQQAAAVVAASRSSTSVSSTTTSQPFSVIQNPALIAMATGTMGGDVSVSSAAASQPGKTSQSQSSTDSSQVDGTQPLLNTNMTFLTDQLLHEPEERLLLHKNFQAVKSKQLSQGHCQSSSFNNSDCVLKNKIPFISSTSCSTRELLMKSSDTTTMAIPQLDGANQESSEEEESEDSEDDDEGVNQDAAEGDDDPLNSDDDDESLKSDDDEKFETENIIVCQFDKVTRTRIGGKNRWKFHLKDGIMNLEGRDYVFQKATGEADW